MDYSARRARRRRDSRARGGSAAEPRGAPRGPGNSRNPWPPWAAEMGPRRRQAAAQHRGTDHAAAGAEAATTAAEQSPSDRGPAHGGPKGGGGHGQNPGRKKARRAQADSAPLAAATPSADDGGRSRRDSAPERPGQQRRPGRRRRFKIGGNATARRRRSPRSPARRWAGKTEIPQLSLRKNTFFCASLR